ncbi:MAG TPA: nitronate monooxygenase [Candidatus Limnocylindria bacterium]|nr:nitronate monooxygenase [Candidatus Limnocylindria bacterium]
MSGATARRAARLAHTTPAQGSETMLCTRFTELLGLRVPIVNAPMTPAAGGMLARAVSEAGGLGFIGVDRNADDQTLRREVALARQDDERRRFGIGLMTWVVDTRPDVLTMVIAQRPALVALSFGDPTPHVPALHDAGILVASQVQDRESALRAADAGVDVIVAQGTEAGGHTGTVGTLPLLQIVLELVDRPVLAAGGIASARGLAAVIAAGADGAWIGTPFLLAHESLTEEWVKQRVEASREGDTILTSLFDRAQGIPWPRQFPGRALRNAFTDRWEGHEDELPAEAIAEYDTARANRDPRLAHVYAGQSVGLAERRLPAAGLVRMIANGAEALLRDRLALVVQKG